jgi:hypothetical protein
MVMMEYEYISRSKYLYLGSRGMRMGRRKLPNEELHSLYHSPNIVRLIMSLT